MSERRPLTEGIRNAVDIDPQAAKEFVYQSKVAPANSPTYPTTTAAGKAVAPRRVQLSTKMRADYFDALKTASLKRQMAKEEPSTLVDILEQAIEPWLKANGYLP